MHSALISLKAERVQSVVLQMGTTAASWYSILSGGEGGEGRAKGLLNSPKYNIVR